MSTSTLTALCVATDRALRVGLPESGWSRRFALYVASSKLWEDEYETYDALHRLGFAAAAECAWQRRCAAADVALVLTTAGLS